MSSSRVFYQSLRDESVHSSMVQSSCTRLRIFYQIHNNHSTLVVEVTVFEASLTSPVPDMKVPEK